MEGSEQQHPAGLRPADQTGGIALRINGVPLPYHVRPTWAVRGRGSAMRLDHHVRAWEDYIILQAGLTRHGVREPHRDTQVSLTLRFDMPMPESWSTAKKRRRAGTPVGVKPDCDDLAKPVIDALKKAGWFYDDSRIVALTIAKRYAATPDDAGVTIDIAYLPPARRNDTDTGTLIPPTTEQE